MEVRGQWARLDNAADTSARTWVAQHRGGQLLCHLLQLCLGVQGGARVVQVHGGAQAGQLREAQARHVLLEAASSRRRGVLGNALRQRAVGPGNERDWAPGAAQKAEEGSIQPEQGRPGALESAQGCCHGCGCMASRMGGALAGERM